MAMNITKETIEQAITLKDWYADKLTELRRGDDDLGLQLPRDAGKAIDRINEFEATHQRNLLKEFMQKLSEAELQDLQAIAFYGRSQYPDFAAALEDATPGRTNEEIDYTMNLIAASDYLEAGFEKLNARREI
jgi:hypothetical protein